MNINFRGIPLDNVTVREEGIKLYVTPTTLVIERGEEWWAYPFPLVEVMKSLVALESRAQLRITYTRNPGDADWSASVEIPAYDRRHRVTFVAYRPSLIQSLMEAQSELMK